MLLVSDCEKNINHLSGFFFFLGGGGVTKLCLQPNVNNIYAVIFLKILF